jgi:hypothetical protein
LSDSIPTSGIRAKYGGQMNLWGFTRVVVQGWSEGEGDKMDSESIGGEEIEGNTVKQQWTLRWLL